MAKRHNWSRGNGWMVCEDCGCRYRTGNITREYQQPDGRRSSKAGPCSPRGERDRLQFEEFAGSDGLGMTLDMDFFGEDPNPYVDADTRLAYRIWLASREALNKKPSDQSNDRT